MESAEAKKEGFPWDLRAVWQVCALELTSLCVRVLVCLGAACATNARTDVCLCVPCVCVCVRARVCVCPCPCPCPWARFRVSVSLFVVVAILDLHKRYQRRHAGRAQVDLRDHHSYATNRREQQTHQVVNMHTECIHNAFTRSFVHATMQDATINCERHISCRSSQGGDRNFLSPPLFYFHLLFG